MQLRVNYFHGRPSIDGQFHLRDQEPTVTSPDVHRHGLTQSSILRPIAAPSISSVCPRRFPPSAPRCRPGSRRSCSSGLGSCLRRPLGTRAVWRQNDSRRRSIEIAPPQRGQVAQAFVGRIRDTLRASPAVCRKPRSRHRKSRRSAQPPAAFQNRDRRPLSAAREHAAHDLGRDVGDVAVTTRTSDIGRARPRTRRHPTIAETAVGWKEWHG